MLNFQGNCWHCGNELRGPDYNRENRCPACGKATHCCRNCRFLTPGKPNDCAEPLVEKVVDKERPNFCDYFEPAAGSGNAQETGPDDLLKAAEDLFK